MSTNNCNPPKPPAKPRRSLHQTASQIKTTYALELTGFGKVPRNGDEDELFEPVLAEVTILEVRGERNRLVSRELESILLIDQPRLNVEDVALDEKPLAEHVAWILDQCGFSELA